MDYNKLIQPLATSQPYQSRYYIYIYSISASFDYKYNINVVCCVDRVQIQVEILKSGRCSANTDSIV